MRVLATGSSRSLSLKHLRTRAEVLASTIRMEVFDFADHFPVRLEVSHVCQLELTDWKFDWKFQNRRQTTSSIGSCPVFWDMFDWKFWLLTSYQLSDWKFPEANPKLPCRMEVFPLTRHPSARLEVLLTNLLVTTGYYQVTCGINTFKGVTLCRHMITNVLNVEKSGKRFVE